jgi:hypothetical protein
MDIVRIKKTGIIQPYRPKNRRHPVFLFVSFGEAWG